MDDQFRDVFTKVTGREDLTRAQARLAIEQIMTGAWPESVIGAFLGALRTKGECVEEVVGAAEAMRAHVIPVHCPTKCIDTCGTGGDGISTFNTSTTAAIIAAGAGATVAKHGNRSTSRVSGSTEVLSELGIDVEADRATVERCLARARIGYLNARLLHPAMKHAAPVRQALGVRTIFNLLGPLTNPAGARRQVLGVPSLELVDMLAAVLAELETAHAWVVHGHDGLCDLTVTGETTVVEVRGRRQRRFVIAPEQVNLHRARLDELRADSPGASARTVLAILQGRAQGPLDHALLNAGAALVVADLASELAEGVQLAARAVEDGAALATLEQWRSIAGMSGKQHNPNGAG